MHTDNLTEEPALPDSSDPASQTEQEPVDLGGLARVWEGLVRLGLGETTLRVGTGVVSIVLFLIVIWVMSQFYLEDPEAAPRQGAFAQALPTAEPTLNVQQIVYSLPSDFQLDWGRGIPRRAQLRTILPSRPRFDVTQYTVLKGDTIFGIAEKFGLKPETILWGNLYTLGDNPHLLQPDVVLNILPVDGVYHKWSSGEGLNGVAEYYGVTPEDIISWPGNHLSQETVGNFSSPNIEPGTWLVVPNGKREFSSWATPRITRGEPAKARNLGPGYCGSVVDGVIGGGTFVWPAVETYLSGYDYSPATNHRGIDIAGDTGHAIYATDHGVVVYAGWNDAGYGNMIVIDHGNGWQSLYAHLSVVSVSCGQSVYQGSTIGLMGSTGNSSGPHLHFEMYNDSYGKVNPWDFLIR